MSVFYDIFSSIFYCKINRKFKLKMLRPLQINTHNSKRWLLCLLLPVLLFTQWLGLAHKISHAGWNGNQAPAVVLQPPAQLGAFLFGSQDDGNIWHSCALYDAATAAEYLQHLPDAMDSHSSKAVAGSRAAILSWLAALQVPFASRAPPSLLA